MRYLALSDSISIDKYTGVPNGGAASQFARLIEASVFQNSTADGSTTDEVDQVLDLIADRPDIVTITVGGNDFLRALLLSDPEEDETSGEFAVRSVGETLDRIDHIAARLATFGCTVIVNTIYDPSDGDDSLADSMALHPSARPAFNALNDGNPGAG